MACKYKDNCPSASGWCELDKHDYENCIPFILSAYERVTESAVESNILIDRLCNELLGEDWYIVDSVNAEQAREIIVDEIISKYKRRHKDKSKSIFSRLLRRGK